ncbi:MAG: Uma2 family endonuclease [Cytophagales bacterium]|jgi:Uma2 family endonuclease|nr:Uma2 family endonuclease [Cytophagales bacterium]
MSFFELNIPTASGQMTDDEFFEFCRQNRDLKFERTSDGQIIFIMPTGTETGRINSKINARLQWWAESHTGEVFDSSTGFKLPNLAVRSPDASWVSAEKWNGLTTEERKKHAPICPDFVVEIRSENDTLRECQDKMDEYMANGARLGWLIDPVDQKAYIYRPGQAVETVSSFQETLSGENVLPNFELNLNSLL